MTTYTDYIYKFPTSGLSTALEAMAQLRTIGVLGAGDIPENMLGDFRDSTGAIVDPYAVTPAYAGRPGTAAYSYTDPITNQTVNVPAAGDPTQTYIHIRSYVTPDQITFDPSTYGLQTCDPSEAQAVLGVWA